MQQATFFKEIRRGEVDEKIAMMRGYGGNQGGRILSDLESLERVAGSATESQVTQITEEGRTLIGHMQTYFPKEAPTAKEILNRILKPHEKVVEKQVTATTEKKLHLLGYTYLFLLVLGAVYVVQALNFALHSDSASAGISVTAAIAVFLAALSLRYEHKAIELVFGRISEAEKSMNTKLEELTAEIKKLGESKGEGTT